MQLLISVIIILSIILNILISRVEGNSKYMKLYGYGRIICLVIVLISVNTIYFFGTSYVGVKIHESLALILTTIIFSEGVVASSRLNALKLRKKQEGPYESGNDRKNN